MFRLVTAVVLQLHYLLLASAGICRCYMHVSAALLGLYSPCLFFSLLAPHWWRLCGLQVEAAALAKEKDALSKKRAAEVERELAALEDTLRPLLLRYQQERARLEDLRRLVQKRDEILVNIQLAEQHNNLARIAVRDMPCWHDVDEANRPCAASEVAMVHVRGIGCVPIAYPEWMHALRWGCAFNQLGFTKLLHVQFVI